MTFLSILATVYGFVGASSNFFQVHKIFKNKSAKDISIINYSILFYGTVIWILYGFEIMSWPVIVTNVTMFIGIGLIIVGWVKYGKTKTSQVKASFSSPSSLASSVEEST